MASRVPARAPSRRSVLRGATAAAALGLTGCSPEASGSAGDVLLGPPDDRDEPAGTPGDRRRGRRNVVVVSIDDLGWRELGCYGNGFNETPEMDRLAAEGTRFTQAYSAAAVCSPTRAALMTGRYPGRVGITDFLRPERAVSEAFLAPEVSTVPDVLGPRGYTCALIGKWHLTETYSGPYRDRPGNPFAHGFDDVRLSEDRYIAGGDYVHPYSFMPDLLARESGEYLTDRLADEVEDYLASRSDAPFFLHVSNYAVHANLEGPPELVAKYERKADAGTTREAVLIAAMLESVDQQVGRIRRALERLGLAEDTVVVVTSDNGGDDRDRNLPLRGGKGALYEGGIRVPLVVWGPGTVLAGRESDLVTNTIDLLPTFTELAGADRPDVDGISISPTLTGRGRQTPRDAVFWAFPHHVGRTRPHAAVRAGDDKLVMYLRDDRVQLFDLARDPGEERDLSTRRPERVARLRRLLEEHLADLDLYPGPPAATPRGGRLRGARGGVVETFDGDLAAYALSAVPAAAVGPRAEVAGGRLRIGSDGGGGQLVALAPDGPRSDEVVIVLDPGPLPRGRRERGLSVGLAADGDTHLLLTYRHDLRAVGWEMYVAGALVDTETEPISNLDGSIDLDSDGARLALCLRGTVGAAYVDQGADQGTGWEFLFRFDVGPAFDLRRRAVRSRLRYAVGGQVDDGQVSIDGFTARSAAGPPRTGGRSSRRRG